MNILLPPELEQFVNEKIAGGAYASPSEVVRDSLCLLKEKDEEDQNRLAELRKEITIGIEQADAGKVAPFNEETLERIKTRARQRLSTH